MTSSPKRASASRNGSLPNANTIDGTTTRLTVTAPTINAARHVRFEIAGADKAATLAQVLEGARDPARLPSQLIAPASGDLVWFVDDAAAAQLRGAR